MKKALSIFILFLLTACQTIPSPNQEVREIFYKYNTLNKIVLEQLDKVLNEEELTKEQKDKYREIFKKQYINLEYKILDQKIIENTAIVLVEITVYDFSKTLSSVSAFKEEFFNKDGNFEKDQYINYKLDELNNTKARIKYTFEISLTNIENSWRVENFLEEKIHKIHGIYQDKY